jgi:hypothetical protein
MTDRMGTEQGKKQQRKKVVSYKRSQSMKSIEKSVDVWWVNYSIASNTLALLGLVLSCCTPEWTIILVKEGVQSTKYALAPFTTVKTTEFESDYEAVKQSNWYLSWCENSMIDEQGCRAAEVTQKSLLTSGIIICLTLFVALLIRFSLSPRGIVPSFTFVRFASALSFIASVLGLISAGAWHRVVEQQLVAGQENIPYVRSGWAFGLTIISACLTMVSFITLWLSLEKKKVITLPEPEENDDDSDSEIDEDDQVNPQDIKNSGLELNHIDKSLN